MVLGGEDGDGKNFVYPWVEIMSLHLSFNFFHISRDVIFGCR